MIEDQASEAKPSQNLPPTASSQRGDFEPLPGPELVFAVAGAVGTDLSLVCQVLKEILREVQYKDACIIRLSELLRSFENNKDIPTTHVDKRTRGLMDAGDALRQALGRGDAMALLGIPAIQQARKDKTKDDQIPASKQAYILHSLKRPEEINTLRKTYGRAFHLISAFANRDVRITSFAGRIAESYHDFNHDKYREVSESLVNRDEADLTKPLGQNMRNTFHMADIFVDATARAKIVEGVGRFIDLIFGKPFVTPTPDELGMFFAHAAALRSADLSRQVGAVIIGDPGEVIGVGCNEVPRPGGGHYWAGDANDARDFILGYDPSVKIKNEMIAQILQLLKDNEWLSDEKSAIDIAKLVADALEDGKPAILKEAQITDILEFGRVVHAEMSAITEAARRGLSVRGATLYCTTYPCHICARHIISSGIDRVVYIEPYPKSMAQRLYPEAITVDGKTTFRPVVKFEPFLGVSPRRYTDLFEAVGRRKDENGQAIEWKRSMAEPRLERMIGSYLGIETHAVGTLNGGLIRAGLTQS